MKAEIKIPAVGESITEATIAQWVKKDGDMVKRDEILLILETDKASVEVVSENEGRLSIKAAEGQTVTIGAVVGFVDTDAKASASSGASSSAGATASSGAGITASPGTATIGAAPAKPTAPPPPISSGVSMTATLTTSTHPSPPKPNHTLSPAVRRIVEEQSLNVKGVTGSGKDGRLTKGDVLNASQTPSMASPAAAHSAPAAMAPAAKSAAAPTPLPQPRMTRAEQAVTREPMTKLRQTIARRLVEAQSNAAILTTFNEIDMTNVMALRAKYKDKFKERYNINLGFMGFFVKAAIEALKAFPRVNGMIDGTDVVFNHFYNIGIAVGTERGLVVPVVRNADLLTIADVEMSIKHYAEKARDGKISIDDLSGGTFTISNGGVYGSLMSTPILNPPQSGILGLHKIEERPVAIQGKVEIRPMMYVALSYDHRIIDGAESVSFLVKIKEGIEDPARLLLEI